MFLICALFLCEVPLRVTCASRCCAFKKCLKEPHSTRSGLLLAVWVVTAATLYCRGLGCRALAWTLDWTLCGSCSFIRSTNGAHCAPALGTVENQPDGP